MGVAEGNGAGQGINPVDDVHQLGLPLVILIGVFRTHRNGPIVKIEYAVFRGLQTNTEACNLVRIELTGQSTEPEAQLVPGFGL